MTSLTSGARGTSLSLRRFATRLAGTYAILYALTTGLALFAPWARLITWVGQEFLALGLTPNLPANGVLDSAYHFAQAWTVLLIAFVGAALWTLLDRRAAR
ncbi:hypothetical protein [Deinococcus maricopensis]|uniref:Uncharacterized protein n=1 Tax=Deinococcus maricopensis (strain DSM 21211 / LMG 22137 / NRRL B-23946 / LB-34) TaxID=709986 RepID=E8U9G2_DEIML|nr:hypothetical protein [Deinococcus maricopensis]ADV67701.1 hypothetical protein Deima_2058 [Deinococcus maricopensis DSM 21211]